MDESRARTSTRRAAGRRLGKLVRTDGIHESMKNEIVSDSIRQFFGGNFHQDWDLVAEEWEGVVDSYATGKDPARLLALAQEVDDLRDTHDEEALQLLMPGQAHCGYNPRPQTTYHEWLGQIANRLRKHAAAIEKDGRAEP